MQVEELESAIKERLNASYVHVIDSSECGQMIEGKRASTGERSMLMRAAVIVSERFVGLSTLKRHRLVNQLLKDEISSIHAFTQKTLTPDEWQDQRC